LDQNWVENKFFNKKTKDPILPAIIVADFL
jgi:hypothetical protein